MATSNQGASIHNTRSISLAWLDANVYSTDNKELLDKLGELFDHTMGFTEEDECIRFLGRGVHDPRRFIVIVSGALGEELVSKIHEHKNVLSIYVYCGWIEKHKKWADKYQPKVKVINQPEDVISGVKADKNNYESA